jgi:hypothetical protein
LVNGQVNTPSLQLAASKSTVYPNPARSFIRIQHFYTGKEPIKIIVYNFLGNKQLELIRPANTIQLDLSEFKRGIYIFQFRDLQDRIIETGKFQVEK